MCYDYKVFFVKGEDGYIVAECPAIPGCVSQGKTLKEAKKNIKEAIELCLECYKEDKKNIPRDRTQIAKIAVNI
ncbi:MAG: type II toxin-antitoxin system HicB family antitoxin [Elusimicrobiota bacterium]